MFSVNVHQKALHTLGRPRAHTSTAFAFCHHAEKTESEAFEKALEACQRIISSSLILHGPISTSPVLVHFLSGVARLPLRTIACQLTQLPPTLTHSPILRAHFPSSQVELSLPQSPGFVQPSPQLCSNATRTRASTHAPGAYIQEFTFWPTCSKP